MTDLILSEVCPGLQCDALSSPSTESHHNASTNRGYSRKHDGSFFSKWSSQCCRLFCAASMRPPQIKTLLERVFVPLVLLVSDTQTEKFLALYTSIKGNLRRKGNTRSTRRIFPHHLDLMENYNHIVVSYFSLHSFSVVLLQIGTAVRGV